MFPDKINCQREIKISELKFLLSLTSDVYFHFTMLATYRPLKSLASSINVLMIRLERFKVENSTFQLFIFLC